MLIGFIIWLIIGIFLSYFLSFGLDNDKIFTPFGERINTSKNDSRISKVLTGFISYIILTFIFWTIIK